MSTAEELIAIAREEGLDGRDIDDFVVFMRLFDPHGHPKYAREWAVRFKKGPLGYLDKDKHHILRMINPEKYGGKT